MTGLVQKLSKGLHLMMDRHYRPALMRGVAAAIEHEPVFAGRIYSTIVDIGANRGQFSLLMARLCPEARIYAFEPLPGAFSTFRKVTAGNHRIAAFNVAVGPSPGPAAFYVAQRADSSSLLPITALQETIFPKTGLSRVEQVEVAPLDSLLHPSDLTPPSLLKIDVQGYELQVLRSCGQLLAAFDTIYIECSFLPLYEGQDMAGDVVAYLVHRGARLDGIYNPFCDRNGRAVQADFLFSNGAGHAQERSTLGEPRDETGGCPSGLGARPARRVIRPTSDGVSS